MCFTKQSLRHNLYLFIFCYKYQCVGIIFSLPYLALLCHAVKFFDACDHDLPVSMSYPKKTENYTNQEPVNSQPPRKRICPSHSEADHERTQPPDDDYRAARRARAFPLWHGEDAEDGGGDAFGHVELLVAHTLAADRLRQRAIGRENFREGRQVGHLKNEAGF